MYLFYVWYSKVWAAIILVLGLGLMQLSNSFGSGVSFARFIKDQEMHPYLAIFIKEILQVPHTVEILPRRNLSRCTNLYIIEHNFKSYSVSNKNFKEVAT